ncbi:hypothetical protein [Terrarubrum flagellatum]|uniref:hypothetical protein n=1 Tax=Terrirubrum flagellatum TaxID=2895980 RepID=UPI0031455CCE
MTEAGASRANVSFVQNGKQVIERYNASWAFTGSDVSFVQNGKQVIEHYNASRQFTGADVMFAQNGKQVVEHYSASWAFQSADVSVATSQTSGAPSAAGSLMALGLELEQDDLAADPAPATGTLASAATIASGLISPAVVMAGASAAAATAIDQPVTLELGPVASLAASSRLGASLSLLGDGTVLYDPTASARLALLGVGETASDSFAYRTVGEIPSLSTATVLALGGGFGPARRGLRDGETSPEQAPTGEAGLSASGPAEAGAALRAEWALDGSGRLSRPLSLPGSALKPAAKVEAFKTEAPFGRLSEAGAATSPRDALATSLRDALAKEETAEIDAWARLRRLADRVDQADAINPETAQSALSPRIDLAAPFTDFRFTSRDVASALRDGAGASLEEEATDWRAELLARLDPGELSAANRALRIAAPAP